jgi:hypothetical protein
MPNAGEGEVAGGALSAGCSQSTGGEFGRQLQLQMVRKIFSAAFGIAQ